MKITQKAFPRICRTMESSPEVTDTTPDPEEETARGSLLSGCQVRIFAQKIPYSKKHYRKKKCGFFRSFQFHFMWTKNEYPQPVLPVDNSCGKTCGECGKLWVINRYSDLFKNHPQLWNFCIPVCIIPGSPVFCCVTLPLAPAKTVIFLVWKVYIL